MTQEELRLEILKTLYPVYKDIMSFKRVADDIYNWIAPEGLMSFKEQEEYFDKKYSHINMATQHNEKAVSEKKEVPDGYKKGSVGRLFSVDKA